MAGKRSLPGTQGSLPFWKQLSPWQGCNPMAPGCKPGLFLLPLLDPHLQEDCHPSPKVPGNVSLIFGTLLSFLKRNWLCWPGVAGQRCLSTPTEQCSPMFTGTAEESPGGPEMLPRQVCGNLVNTVQLAGLKNHSRRLMSLGRADGPGWQTKEVCLHGKELPEPAPTDLFEWKLPRLLGASTQDCTRS